MESIRKKEKVSWKKACNKASKKPQKKVESIRKKEKVSWKKILQQSKQKATEESGKYQKKGKGILEKNE